MADITHGTWIKDGKAVDAVYQDGIKVYGRNLALGTANAFTTIGSGSHWMYSLSRTIPKGTTVTVSYDIASTKSGGTYTSQFVWGWQGSPVLPITAGTQHESYTIVTNADYSVIQMAIGNSTATVTVSNLIISESSKEVAWAPAPEDILK